MSVIHLTNENFENEVLNSDKPVLIDFWASWCGPCMMLAPVIEELGEEVTEAKICKVDVDRYPSLAEKYNVMSIPTLVLIKNGNEVAKSIGVKPKAEILEMLK